MSLPVLLDATPLGRGHGQRGIGAALRHLLPHIPAEDRPTLLVTPEQSVPDGFHAIVFRWPHWPIGRAPDPWPDLALPRTLRRVRPGLFHTSRPDLVPGGGLAPTLLTVHDLIPLHYPYRNPLFRRAFSRYLGRVRVADAFISGSHAAAADLTAQLGIPPSRITVIHHGVPPAPAPHGATPTEPYVLYANGIEPHKNAALAIDAVARVPKLRLVMAGSWGGKRLAALREHAERARVVDRVDWLGYIPGPLLAALRRDAVATLVPSRMEGFGFPVLESLTAGTPVVASDIAVLREVGGAVATYRPLDDPDAWASALVAVQAPEHREMVAERGPAHAATFSWERAARENVAVWKRMLTRD